MEAWISPAMGRLACYVTRAGNILLPTAWGFLTRLECYVLDALGGEEQQTTKTTKMNRQAVVACVLDKK